MLTREEKRFPIHIVLLFTKIFQTGFMNPIQWKTLNDMMHREMIVIERGKSEIFNRFSCGQSHFSMIKDAAPICMRRRSDDKSVRGIRE